MPFIAKLSSYIRNAGRAAQETGNGWAQWPWILSEKNRLLKFKGANYVDNYRNPIIDNPETASDFSGDLGRLDPSGKHEQTRSSRTNVPMWMIQSKLLQCDSFRLRKYYLRFHKNRQRIRLSIVTVMQIIYLINLRKTLWIILSECNVDNLTRCSTFYDELKWHSRSFITLSRQK